MKPGLKVRTLCSAHEADVGTLHVYPEALLGQNKVDQGVVLPVHRDQASLAPSLSPSLLPPLAASLRS